MPICNFGSFNSHSTGMPVGNLKLIGKERLDDRNYSGADSNYHYHYGFQRHACLTDSNATSPDMKTGYQQSPVPF